MIDQALFLVRYQKPFLEWRRKALAKSQGGISPLADEPTAWALMHPDYFDDPDQFAEYLDELKPILFEEMLLEWCTDESLWPKSRTAAEFNLWFQAELISNVRSVDELLGDEVSNDKVDQADAFLRTTVEYQVRNNEPPEVRATLSRLEQVGFPREEALKLIMLALACELGAAAESDNIADLNQEKYSKYLDQLPNTAFVQDWAGRNSVNDGSN